MITPLIIDAIPYWDYQYVEYEEVLEMEKNIIENKSIEFMEAQNVTFPE